MWLWMPGPPSTRALCLCAFALLLIAFRSDLRGHVAGESDSLVALSSLGAEAASTAPSAAAAARRKDDASGGQPEPALSSKGHVRAGRRTADDAGARKDATATGDSNVVSRDRAPATHGTVIAETGTTGAASGLTVSSSGQTSAPAGGSDEASNEVPGASDAAKAQSDAAEARVQTGQSSDSQLSSPQQDSSLQSGKAETTEGQSGDSRRHAGERLAAAEKPSDKAANEGTESRAKEAESRARSPEMREETGVQVESKTGVTTPAHLCPHEEAARRIPGTVSGSVVQLKQPDDPLILQVVKEGTKFRWRGSARGYNPMVFRMEDELIVLTRISDWIMYRPRGTPGHEWGKFFTRLALCKVPGNVTSLRACQPQLLPAEARLPQERCKFSNGVEDVRLFRRGTELWGLGNIRGPRCSATPMLVQYDRETLRPQRYVFVSHQMRGYQKNWVVVDAGPHLGDDVAVVTSRNPTIIGRLSLRTGEFHSPLKYNSTAWLYRHDTVREVHLRRTYMRGGTNHMYWPWAAQAGLPEVQLTVLHFMKRIDVPGEERPRNYYFHVLVAVSVEYPYYEVARSAPFKFTRTGLQSPRECSLKDPEPVQYAMGIACADAECQHVWISYGIMDWSANAVKVRAEDLNRMLVFRQCQDSATAVDKATPETSPPDQ